MARASSRPTAGRSHMLKLRTCVYKYVNSTTHWANITRAKFSRAWLKLQRFVVRLTILSVCHVPNLLHSALCSSRLSTPTFFIAFSSEHDKSLCTATGTCLASALLLMRSQALWPRTILSQVKSPTLFVEVSSTEIATHQT